MRKSTRSQDILEIRVNIVGRQFSTDPYITFLLFLLAGALTAFFLYYIFKDVGTVNDIRRYKQCLSQGQRAGSLLFMMIRKCLPLGQSLGRFFEAHLKDWGFLNSGLSNCGPNPPCVQRLPGSPSVSPFWDVEGKENQPENEVCDDCCVASEKKSFVPDLRVLHLLLASLKLWQASLLTYK